MIIVRAGFSVISTRALPPRIAIGLASLLNFAGAFISLAVAAWMVYVLKTPDLDDPQAARLRAALTGASGPAAVVDALLGVESVFTPDLRDSRTFRQLLIEHVSSLLARS